MSRIRITLTVGLLCQMAVGAEVIAQPPDEPQAPASAVDCIGELDFAAAFLLENDAGVRASGWEVYPPRVAESLRDSRVAAGSAVTVDACVEQIRQFLPAIRRGHLSAIPLVTETGATVDLAAALNPTPSLTTRRLSAQTAYLEVPSFMGDVGSRLQRIVDTHQDGVGQTPNLIIDLRRNEGGADSAWQPLVPVLGPATYRWPSPSLLVTPANIAAWEAMIPLLSSHPDLQWMNTLLTRMKAAGEGWVRMMDEAFIEAQIKADPDRATPERIAVLIGPACASSCEQFVITARQNPRVTLIGQKTYGALDASNMRLAPTPSGRIAVYYTTTFVHRPDGEQIDEIGIAPDLERSSPVNEEAFAAEVAFAQTFLERPAATQARQGKPASRRPR